VFDTSNEGFMYPQDSHTFMVTVGASETLGQEPRMLAFFKLDPNSTQTELKITNDSTKLDYTALLQQAVPMRVPAATPGVTVDWSAMTTNALGNQYRPTQINQAVVAHYSNLSLADLE